MPDCAGEYYFRVRLAVKSVACISTALVGIVIASLEMQKVDRSEGSGGGISKVEGLLSYKRSNGYSLLVVVEAF